MRWEPYKISKLNLLSIDGTQAILSQGEKTTCSRLLVATQNVPSQKVDYNLAQVSVYKCYLGLLQRPRSPYFLMGQYPSCRLVQPDE